MGSVATVPRSIDLRSRKNTIVRIASDIASVMIRDLIWLSLIEVVIIDMRIEEPLIDTLSMPFPTRSSSGPTVLSSCRSRDPASLSSLVETTTDMRAISNSPSVECNTLLESIGNIVSNMVRVSRTISGVASSKGSPVPVSKAFEYERNRSFPGSNSARFRARSLSVGRR